MQEKWFEENVYFGNNDSPERITWPARRKAALTMNGSLGISGVAGIATVLAEQWANHTQNPLLLPPLEYAAIYHTGDFMNGFIDAYLPAMFLGMLFPKMPYPVKTAIATGLSLTSLAWAKLESPIQPHFISIPDLADVPMGLLGIGLFVGASIWANRRIRKGPATP